MSELQLIGRHRRDKSFHLEELCRGEHRCGVRPQCLCDQGDRALAFGHRQHFDDALFAFFGEAGEHVGNDRVEAGWVIVVIG